MEPQARRRGRWRAAALTIVGLAIAVWLLKSVAWPDILAAIGRLGWTHLSIGFGIYLVFLVFKAARFGALLKLQGQSRQLFGAVCAQTFWSNFLPMRAGDLSYVLVMAKREDVGSSRAVASLVVAALLDLAWTLLFAAGLALALTTSGNTTRAVTVILPFAALGLMGITGLLVLSRALSEEHIQAATCLVRRVPVVGSWAARVVGDVRDQARNRPFVAGGVCSGLALALRYAFQIYLLRVMFTDISAVQGLYALAVAGIANMLPIQGVANVGSIELPWSWAATSAGVSPSTAVAAAFALHGVVIAYAVAAGLLSLVLLARQSRQIAAP